METEIDVYRDLFIQIVSIPYALYEYTQDNIMNISFSDQGIIKTAHGLNTSPISHTLTYGSEFNGVKDIRKWMQLEKNIQSAVNADAQMKSAATANLSKVLVTMESEGGFEAEGLGQIRDMVSLYNSHHTFPLVKASIFRMFKDRMLNKLNKPNTELKNK